jgi:hypothetical protein
MVAPVASMQISHQVHGPVIKPGSPCSICGEEGCRLEHILSGFSIHQSPILVCSVNLVYHH